MSTEVLLGLADKHGLSAEREVIAVAILLRSGNKAEAWELMKRTGVDPGAVFDELLFIEEWKERQKFN